MQARFVNDNQKFNLFSLLYFQLRRYSLGTTVKTGTRARKQSLPDPAIPPPESSTSAIPVVTAMSSAVSMDSVMKCGVQEAWCGMIQLRPVTDHEHSYMELFDLPFNIFRYFYLLLQLF